MAQRCCLGQAGGHWHRHLIPVLVTIKHPHSQLAAWFMQAKGQGKNKGESNSNSKDGSWLDGVVVEVEKSEDSSSRAAAAENLRWTADGQSIRTERQVLEG